MKRHLYLAHPWDMHSDIRKWQLEIEQKTNIKFENPFYDNLSAVEKSIENEWVKQRRIKRKNQGTVIIDKDLRAIERNDGILAFLEYGMHSIGTPMEIFYCSRILQKPTYIISTNTGGHPWVRGLATKIFTSREKFEKWADKTEVLKK